MKISKTLKEVGQCIILNDSILMTKPDVLRGGCEYPSRFKHFSHDKRLLCTLFNYFLEFPVYLLRFKRFGAEKCRKLTDSRSCQIDSRNIQVAVYPKHIPDDTILKD